MTIHGRLALGLAIGALLAAPVLASPAQDPPRLAGSWAWKWKDAQGETHRHVLELEGEGAKLAGRERFDDAPAVKVDNLKVDGKTIQFSVSRGERMSLYKGTVASAGIINGLVTVTEKGQANEFGWTATREAGVK
jgi:hypothetical protein